MTTQAVLDVVVLAAGKGTRLNSQQAKVLHPLFEKPLLGHVLEQLKQLPVQQVSVVVGHQKEAVTAFVDSTALFFPFDVGTVVQQPQNGTGHAVQCVKHAGAIQSEHVLVLSGDVPLISQATLSEMWHSHVASSAAVTLLGARVENPTGYGRIIQDKNRVSAIVEEKDATDVQRQVNIVNTGIYLFQWSVIAPLLEQLNTHNAQGELYLTDVISLAVQHNKGVQMTVLDRSEQMQGVNTRADLAGCYQTTFADSVARLQAAGVTIVDPASTWIGPDVTIGADTIIYPGCYLSGAVTIGGQCEIGPHAQCWGEVTLGDRVVLNQSVIRDSTVADDVTIGPFAHIRNGSTIASNVRLGNFVEVKNTSIGSNSNAAHLAYLGDAELGEHVNMGAGSITANYDPIRDTKHTTVIQSGVKVGCNSVLVAPVCIGEDACVAAGSVITKDVDALALAITRPRQSSIVGWVKRIKQSMTSVESL